MGKTKHKKSLGQNFLTDMDVVDQIVDAADIARGDVVIEVGPGEGVLTQQLLDAGARVFAVEIDGDLIPRLEERFTSYENCTILNVDIRRFNIPQFLKEEKVTTYKVVANLPYYITSSIIRLFLESEVQPSEMVIMVQKEVAERICAAPGAMSILSAAVQFYGTPEYLFTVPAQAFDPAPQVDSAVLRVDEIDRLLSIDDEKEFFRTVKAGFSARRKKLVNNLANSLHKEKSDIEVVLTGIGLVSTMRAQELSIDQWKTLAQSLRNLP